MLTSKRLAAAACMLVITVGATTSASAQTLADTLATAYRNSGLIEQNRAVLRAADEDVAQAVAALRPAINWVAQANYLNPTLGDSVTGSLGLSADLLLFDFGRTRLGIDAAKETVLATRQALLDVENSVLFNAVDAHLAVRLSEVLVSLGENNVRLLNEQLRATRDRFDVGEVTRTDVSLAEARLAAARSGLAAQQGGLARAREAYRAVVGEYPGSLAIPSAPNVPASEDAARAIARQENPQVLQVQHQVAAVELLVEQARLARNPTLSTSVGLGVDQDGNDSAQVGLRFAGPIYRGGAISSQSRKAQAQRDQVRALLYTTGLLVDQQVGNAYANLAVAVASIDASQSEVAAATLALEGVQEELQLGARTTLDVLDREQELLDARTTLVRAQADRIRAAYQVLDATGRLTAANLGLNVPIYDPAAYYNSVKDAPFSVPSKQSQQLDRVLRSIGKE